MITVGSSILIRGAPEQVFPILLNPQTLEKTLPPFLNIKVTRKDHIGVGSKMHWILKKQDGTTIEWDEEYTVYEEYTHLCWKSSGGPYWQGEYRLHKVSAGTYLVMIETTDYFDTALAFQKVIDSQLRKTKQIIESQIFPRE